MPNLKTLTHLQPGAVSRGASTPEGAEQATHQADGQDYLPSSVAANEAATDTAAYQGRERTSHQNRRTSTTVDRRWPARRPTQ